MKYLVFLFTEELELRRFISAATQLGHRTELKTKKCNFVVRVSLNDHDSLNELVRFGRFLHGRELVPSLWSVYDSSPIYSK